MYYETSQQERVRLGFCDHECNDGMHFCGLYETAQERDEIILGFLMQGLIEHNKCLYAPAERSVKDFYRKFEAAFPEKRSLIHENPDLLLSTVEDLYFKEGDFSPFHMDRNLNSYYCKTQKNGKKHIRATTEMVWALDKKLDKKKLMAYESRLNYFIPGKPWISICMYNISRFDGKSLMMVLQTHPFTITKNCTITKNPYFISPDQWLQENAPEYR